MHPVSTVNQYMSDDTVIICVYSCGGGIIETPQAHSLLCKIKNRVIHLYRHFDDVLQTLTTDEDRPSFVDDLRYESVCYVLCVCVFGRSLSPSVVLMYACVYACVCVCVFEHLSSFFAYTPLDVMPLTAI